MLREKLRIDSKYYKDRSVALYAKDKYNKMDLTIKFLNRLIDDNYLENAFVNHDKKWGKSEMIFHDSGRVEITREDVHTKEDEEQERKEFIKCFEHSQYTQKQDIKNLFKILEKNILYW